MKFLSVSIAVLSGAAAAASTNTSSWDTETWDVIIVGAGPAGIIVADRLSEAGRKTLLIEGGGLSYGVTGGTDRPDWLKGTNLSRVDVPGLYKSIFSDQGDLTCQAVTNAFGGCTIGGSSAINAGLFFQPPDSDFDLYFPDGWKSKDVKNATQKVYSRVPSDDVYSQDKKFYVQSGYDAAVKWIVDGAGFANIDLNAQANQKTKVFGRPVFDYNNGQRGGPVTTYLQTALTRANFHLQHSTRVDHVVRSGDTATGVVVIVNGAEKTVSLNPDGRVILSGGALQSPQILWFSGVGDPSLESDLISKGLLKDAQSWINNTAVGDGLFDNPNTFIELSGPSIQSYVYQYDNPPAADAAAYINSRSGPYSFASETSAFWSTITHDDGSITGLQGTIDSSGFADWTSSNTITLNVYGTSGLKSSGKVVLGNKNLPGPSDDVYYSDPRDADDIATFIRSIYDGLDGNVLKPLNLPLNSTQQQIRDYITSQTAYTRGEVNHWSSSCRIGSCVDVNTVVKGTKNIHVVDGSIVSPLTVNPQVPVAVLSGKKLVS
jgi:cellobiose dehydrogenase (acceptor)